LNWFGKGKKSFHQRALRQPGDDFPVPEFRGVSAAWRVGGGEESYLIKKSEEVSQLAVGIEDFGWKS